MEKFTKEGKAQTAADRWKRQYCIDGKWSECAAATRGGAYQVHANLLDLGPFPKADDVDRVIGNVTWTSCHCNECNTNVDCVVQLGDAPDYESCTAWVCISCLQKALSL